jgi:hypothetical protein
MVITPQSLLLRKSDWTRESRVEHQHSNEAFVLAYQNLTVEQLTCMINIHHRDETTRNPFQQI